MKRVKLIAGFVVFAVLMSAAAEAQWVFVARKAMGRIKQMQSDHADVAAVILEAKAADVYRKAVSTIQANDQLKVLGKDDSQMTLGFAAGQRKVKMQVSELSDQVSEILISASPAKGGDSTSSIVVEKIMEVCKAVKVECRLAKE